MPPNTSPSQQLFQGPNVPMIEDMPASQNKKPKKAIIFIVVAILLLGAIIFTTVMLTKQKPQGSTEDITQSFLTKVESGEYVDAYKMINPESKLNKSQAMTVVGDMSYLKKNYPINGCKKSQVTDEAVTYTCDNQSSKRVTVKFDLTNISGKTSMVGFKLESEQTINE